MLNSNGFVKIIDRFIPGSFTSNDEGVVEERATSRASTHGNSRPISPPLSPGSSVATNLREEFDSVIKNAVIVPTFNIDNANMCSKITERHDRNCDKNILSIERPSDNRLTAENINDMNNFDNTGKLYLHDHHKDINNTENDNNENDLQRMKRLLTGWTDNLNSKIMDQFKLFMFDSEEECKLQVLATREKCNLESQSMHREMTHMRQTLENFNKLNDKKELIIKNLSIAVSESHTRLQKQKVFGEWRLKMVDAKREAFADCLAMRYYKRAISQKVFLAWRSVIQVNWKAKVERACQLKSQEVCLKLNKEYEAKIEALKQELVHSQLYIEEMHINRDVYESSVKKAIIRGVTALNTETMGVIDGGGEMNQQNPWDLCEEDDLDLLCPEHLRLTMLSLNPKTKKSNAKYSSRVKDFNKKFDAKILSNRQVASNNFNLPNNILIERHKPFDKAICSNVGSTKCPLCRAENTRQPAIINKRMQASHAPFSNIHTIRVSE